MLITTTDDVPGRTITEVLGLIQVSDYAKSGPDVLLHKVQKVAAKKGADAVVAYRISVSANLSVDLAVGYGTLVRLD